MNRLLLGFILLSVSWTASAADTALYKVELIVFENLDPAALQAEDWQNNPEAPSLEDAKELAALTVPATPAPPPVPAPATAAPAPGKAPALAMPPAAVPTVQATPAWRRLDKSELGLKGAEQRLRGSGHYRPLLHIGWVQPLDSSDQGTALHIYDGMEAARPGGAAVTGANNETDTAPAQKEAASQPEAPQPKATEETPRILNGTFTLRRGRFLHVDVDMAYRKTYVPAGTPPEGGAAQPVTRYVRMTQSRRLRSDELHYLDHPLFGVLFVVSNYQEKPADTTAR